jgi:8-oxo-dGTP diphosphatase
MGPGATGAGGETALACAVRECEEETGLVPVGVEALVELRFLDVDEHGEPPMLGIAFRADGFRGRARETPEAAPFWCGVADIPYARMWADDRIWLPCLLAREPVRGEFVMAGDRLVAHRVVGVERGYLQALANRLG